MKKNIDTYILQTIKKISEPAARVALALIFIWFGAIKVIFLSPANELVSALLSKTMPFIPFTQFIIILGIFEVIIGILFLIPKMARVAVIILLLHMGMTVLPLVLLPDITWSGLLIPTLEGQYIIKNVALIALGLGVVAHFHET